MKKPKIDLLKLIDKCDVIALGMVSAVCAISGLAVIYFVLQWFEMI